MPVGNVSDRMPARHAGFATFCNVGGTGITDIFDQADLTAVDIGTDTANSPPFDRVCFDTTNSSVLVSSPCCSYANGIDYLTGLAGETLQPIQNDTTGLDTWYDETFSAVPVPEPASLALLSRGAAGLAMVRRRRR
jgi:hypothetical protein